MKVQEFKLMEKTKESNQLKKDKILQYAYSLEINSNHPISNAIIEYAKEKNTKALEVEAQKEIAGCGIYGKIEAKDIIIGNNKMLERYNIAYEKIPENAILIAVDRNLVAYITLEENIREGFKETLSKLYNIGIKKVVMLTGDSNDEAKKIAKECGKIDYKAKLMPDGKVEEINKLKKLGKVIFIGDGINDSPVLATSDFGIAMGEGTDIAETTADSINI